LSKPGRPALRRIGALPRRGELRYGVAPSVLIAKFVAPCGELGTNFAI
jgi:hypothetical protein